MSMDTDTSTTPAADPTTAEECWLDACAQSGLAALVDAEELAKLRRIYLGGIAAGAWLVVRVSLIPDAEAREQAQSALMNEFAQIAAENVRFLGGRQLS